jgi:hypothetical protein
MRAWISVTDFPARFGKADVRAFATACHINNQQQQNRGEVRAGHGIRTSLPSSTAAPSFYFFVHGIRSRDLSRPSLQTQNDAEKL